MRHRNASAGGALSCDANHGSSLTKTARHAWLGARCVKRQIKAIHFFMISSSFLSCSNKQRLKRFVLAQQFGAFGDFEVERGVRRRELGFLFVGEIVG